MSVCSTASIAVGGHLLFSDSGNGQIRIVNKTTNQVSLIAGGSSGTIDGYANSAGFNSPEGLTVDPDDGLVYIICPANLRVLNVTSKYVSTLAGPYSTDSSLIDGVGPNARFVYGHDIKMVEKRLVIIADRIALRLVNITTRNVTTLVGSGSNVGPYLDGIGTSIRCNGVYGVAVSLSGLVYFTDYGAVRSTNITTANVTTVFGQVG